MTCTCPTCGQSIDGPAPVKALADANLSVMQQKIVAALTSSYPNGIRTPAMVDIIYADDPDGGPDFAVYTLRMMMVRLRRKLKPHGWTVSVNKPGKSNVAIYRLERVQ